MTFRERFASYFRSKVYPASKTDNTIRMNEEVPWNHEQMAFWNDVQLRKDNQLDPLTNESWEQRLRYRLMMAEPTVKAAYIGKVGSVCSQELRVNPPRYAANNPYAKEIADFVQHNLTGPSGTSYEPIWEIGSGLGIEGFSVCEKLIDYQSRGFYRGKWTLERLKAKDTRYIQLETDRFRNVTGLFSSRAGQSNIPFDPADFVICSYLPFFSNPHGWSDFRSSYRAVELIKNALELRTQTLAKNVGPYLVAKVADRRFADKVAAELKRARANGYLVLTDNTDLQLIDLASRGTTEFQQAIDDLRKEIAIGIQGAFLQMLEGTGTDNRGNSQVQKETSEIFAWLYSVTITQAINRQIIPDLVFPNYGPDAPLPVAQLGAINPADILADLAIDRLLNVEIGLDLSAEDLYKRGNRKPPMNDADRIPGKKQATTAPTGGALPMPFSETSSTSTEVETDDEKKK